MKHPNDFLKRMRSIVSEAGRLSMEYLADSAPAFKADQSIITKADTAISILVRRSLIDVLSGSEHLLIDEEDEDRGKYLDPEVLSKAKYLWVLDPIDGTRVYANRMPHFGISLGVVKDFKPWLGMVYFPFLKELFYSDGEHAYFVQNAFQSDEFQVRLKPIDQDISNLSIFFCTDNFFKHFQWDYQNCHTMISSCGVVDFLWPTIGRGCGTITKCYLWDFAGAWPVVQGAGLHLRSVETGKILDRVDVSLFHHERVPWKLKDFYILSSERNFFILKGKMKWQG